MSDGAGSYAALPLPSYIKPCARDDPNLVSCALEHGKAAIPQLIKGDRKYGIPNLGPVEIAAIKVPAGAFEFDLKNVTIYGLKDVDLKRVEFDLKQYQVSYDMILPVLEIRGHYEINGKILLLPITGSGEMNITLASYLKPCARSDPGFEACALQSAQETIKHIVNGDRKYKIPAIDPLEIIEIIVAKQGHQQAGIDIKFNNAKIYGLKDSIIKGVKINYDKKMIAIDLVLPWTNLLGEYEVSGRVLLLPITGKGPINVTLDDTTTKFESDWIVKKKGGNEFMTLINSRLTNFEPKRVHYDLQNLFNGDKLLGTQMNNFLNENWKESFQELSPPIIQAISTVIASIVNNVAYVVDYKTIFPLNV